MTEADPVCETMNGPNEFMVIGKLIDWDRMARLGEVRTPTLIAIDRYDELTPACAETVHLAIPNSQLVVFEDSGYTGYSVPAYSSGPCLTFLR